MKRFIALCTFVLLMSFSVGVAHAVYTCPMGTRIYNTGWRSQSSLVDNTATDAMTTYPGAWTFIVQLKNLAAVSQTLSMVVSLPGGGTCDTGNQLLAAGQPLTINCQGVENTATGQYPLSITVSGTQRVWNFAWCQGDWQ